MTHEELLDMRATIAMANISRQLQGTATDRTHVITKIISILQKELGAMQK